MAQPKENHPECETQKCILNLTRIGYHPVLAGNFPDSIFTLEKPVGRLPTGTGKLPMRVKLQ